MSELFSILFSQVTIHSITYIKQRAARSCSLLVSWFITTHAYAHRFTARAGDRKTDKSINSQLTKTPLLLLFHKFFPQVSLILFNSTTFLPADKDVDECYNTTMAFASTFTINYLKSFINSAQPRGRKATAYAVNSYFLKYLPVPTFELARAGKEWQTYC